MNQNIYIIIIITLIILIFIKLQSNDNINYKQIILQDELNKKINVLNNILEKQKQQNQENSNHKTVIVPLQKNPNSGSPDIVDIRDVNVTENPLYPLYGRSERPIIDMLMTNNMFNMRTRGSDDTYHPVGYAKETKTGEIFYVMGRQRYSGSSQGDFYLISTDTNNRLKINLLDRSGNQIIKDIYNLPDRVDIKNGVFNGKSFQIEQLKNTDLISPYY